MAINTADYDYVIVGSGIGGMLTAALLARAGKRVCLLERHAYPGGYGHSFEEQGYTFCAELHYLWNCGPDQEFGQLLRHLGLEEQIKFVQLDPQGYDRVRFPSFGYDFVHGLQQNCHLLSARYPQYRDALSQYFAILDELNRELYQLPLAFSKATLLAHPYRFRRLIQYRNWTTGDLFTKLGLPQELQSILAGQSGDLGLPPRQASLALQAAITCGYASGAYVPQISFQHLFQTLVDFIRRQPGCNVQFNRLVDAFMVAGNSVEAVHLKHGEIYTANQFIYNGDPKLLRKLVAMPLPRWFDRRLDYEYSASSFTLYLGVRDLDLASYGFGNWNVWHYQHDDINRCYQQQLEQHCLDDPMLFFSTPTLHHKQGAIAPPGCDQMVVCTPCSYRQFADWREHDRQRYQAEKDRITQSVLDTIERHYIPNLRQHLDLVIAGSPVTNERFVLAPQGNAYGANLTPKHINTGKVDYRSPFTNLWLIGATAGTPSFAGGTHFATMLYERLTGQSLKRG